MNDIVMNKKESIERCIRRVRDYYKMPGDLPLESDHMKQDAVAINIQRACEQCIDLANYTIKTRKLGLPKESRESFRLLAEHGIIPGHISASLERMVGFRNVLVHQYQKLDISVMVDVIENRLDDLLEFTDRIMNYSG